VYRIFPGRDNVLFADQERLAILRDILISLGGARKREPGSAFEVPNQPIGPSMTILPLFNTFFPAVPGHWGGWEFPTYPVIARIEFTNKEQTKALVSITIGYGGTDVLMEKGTESGWRKAWRAVFG